MTEPELYEVITKAGRDIEAALAAAGHPGMLVYIGCSFPPTSWITTDNTNSRITEVALGVALSAHGQELIRRNSHGAEHACPDCAPAAPTTPERGH